MEVKGKYLIAFDTICDGNQTATDENNLPQLFDSEADAFFELFCDAMAGLEGTDDDYFEENEIDKDETLAKMQELKDEGNFFKMKNWFDANPSANYYDEWIESAEDFVLGRKAIFTGKGVVIEGTKLEEL